MWNDKIDILLSSSSTYMIYIPGSSHVLLSNVKAAYKTYIFKVNKY